MWASVVDAFLALGLPKCLSGSSFLPGFSGRFDGGFGDGLICMCSCFNSPLLGVYRGKVFKFPYGFWEGAVVLHVKLKLGVWAIYFFL